VELTRALVEDAKAGRIILFLGAGASAGAMDSAGNGPPLGHDLRDMLVSKYLTPEFSNRSLGAVAELAISEQTLPEVQDFIAGHLKDLEPAEFHKALATLKWRAIATTNYDRIIEKAWRQNPERAQDLIPILSNEDRVDEKLRGDSNCALFKLHGCVTVTHRPDLPLILTVDQYATHQENREYVFSRFEGWAREYPVVFVGHSLEDPDVRTLLLKLTKSGAARPRYFLVAPNITGIESRFWESKTVTTLKGTLEEFVAALEREIPTSIRPLLGSVSIEHPVRRLFVVDEPVPPSVAAMLENDVEYVHKSLPPGPGSAEAFYRGFGLGWYPVQRNLDVRRGLTDTLLTDVTIRPEDDRPSVAELYVIDAAAGSGKSVLLRRVAWEAAVEADVLSLFVRPFGSPDPDALAELYRLTGRRIFVHWDDAASHVADLRRLLAEAQAKELPLTVITAERTNEWNMSCESLSRFVSDRFDLRRLSEHEISALVRLLAEHECLGPNLQGKTEEERVEEFVVVAGRHLLVALHEATTGRPFADILEDEYTNLRPTKAKLLYLTVCVLNRLKTAVRAGLVSRVHNIPFEEFKAELFSPLERVVEVAVHKATGDYYYQARHPEIAQIVFTRILSNRDDRLNEYLRIIGSMNLAFDSDREAFRGLLRARALHELFPDYKDVRTIFAKAEEVGSREAYLYQQRANYERIRPDGNFDEAEEFLSRARSLDPRDASINHTLAEVYRAKAEAAESPLARQRYRAEARSMLRDLLSGRGSDEYARVTLVKLGIDEVRDLLARAEATDSEIDAVIRDVDRVITEAIQQHPDEQYLLTAEADFSQLISDDERSFAALKRASTANPRDPYIANRLSRACLQRGEIGDAKETLWRALEGNRGDMRLNFQYGEVLRLSEEVSPEALAYYYERAFTPGDRNYEAQFWFARYAFESSDERLQDKAKRIFRTLRNASMAHPQRVKIRDVIQEKGRPKVFQGAVDRIEQTYGKIRRDGPSDLIFVHSNSVETSVWTSLESGTRVCFAVGFCFNGPTAIEAEVLDL
jgi:tetratricopeptide (TPR) repeat protein